MKACLDIEIADHLKYIELCCPGTDIAVYTLGLLEKWTNLRGWLDVPLTIAKGGGYRTPEYQAIIDKSRGRESTGQHVLGNALDVVNKSVDWLRDDLMRMLVRIGYKGIGRRATGAHLDDRKGPFMCWLYSDSGLWHTDHRGLEIYNEMMAEGLDHDGYR